MKFDDAEDSEGEAHPVFQGSIDKMKRSPDRTPAAKRHLQLRRWLQQLQEYARRDPHHQC